jgi:hypothetical protein
LRGRCLAARPPRSVRWAAAASSSGRCRIANAGDPDGAPCMHMCTQDRRSAGLRVDVHSHSTSSSMENTCGPIHQSYPRQKKLLLAISKWQLL